MVAAVKSDNRILYNLIYRQRGGYSNCAEAKIMLGLLGLARQTGKRFLDIACGDGELLRQACLQNPQNKYYGCDISDFVIRQNRIKFKDISFSVENAEKLTYKS